MTERTWLLCDYGEVLSHAPSEDDRAELADLAGAARELFWSDYWSSRTDYDRGALSNQEYWDVVLGHPVEPDLLLRLMELDARMWSRPRESSLRAAHGAAAHGLRLAILSNAPAALADAFDRLDWLSPFSPRLFSGHLGVVKPDPRIYRTALEVLGAPASRVIFVDDRPENVAAARALGIDGRVFEGAATLADIAPLI